MQTADTHGAQQDIDRARAVNDGLVTGWFDTRWCYRTPEECATHDLACVEIK